MSTNATTITALADILATVVPQPNEMDRLSVAQTRNVGRVAQFRVRATSALASGDEHTANHLLGLWSDWLSYEMREAGWGASALGVQAVASMDNRLGYSIRDTPTDLTAQRKPGKPVVKEMPLDGGGSVRVVCRDLPTLGEQRIGYYGWRADGSLAVFDAGEREIAGNHSTEDDAVTAIVAAA